MNTEWEKILSAWGIEPADIEQKYPTVWEINHQYMLKEYENPKSLERNIQSLTALSECGAPVAGIIKTGRGKPYRSGWKILAYDCKASRQQKDGYPGAGNCI